MDVRRAEAEWVAASGAMAVCASGHLSVAGHLRLGGSPDEGAERALALYRERGRDVLLESVSGEFALAILDSGRLVLVADILNNVPLYWGETRSPLGDCVLCVGTGLAEVAEALALEGGARCVPDKLFLTGYLSSTVHLLQHTLRTPLDGVSRVPGGHAVTLDLEGGTRQVRNYWDPASLTALKSDVPEAVERLDEILEGAVRECFAHGPVAISTSGGLDSGTVAAYAGRVAPDRTVCLTLGSQRWPTIPEDRYARRNAEGAGLSVHVVDCDDAQPFRQFDPASVYLGGLPANILAEFHHRLADRAQALGAATTLDGDGGDEFFGIGHLPVYLRDLARAGDWRRAVEHLQGWNRRLVVSPLSVAYQALRPSLSPLPRLQPWLLRATETAALLRDPLVGAPAALAGRLRIHQLRVDLTENWWSSRVVYAPRGMRLLHPLRAREVAELTYALPQWILQHPGDYKWLLRQTARLKFPQIPFEPVNSDYSHLITHGVRLERDRFRSYFQDDCRLVAHGIAGPEIRDFVGGYLRDPAGEDDWSADGMAVVGQVALFAELWLRGYEEVYGK